MERLHWAEGWALGAWVVGSWSFPPPGFTGRITEHVHPGKILSSPWAQQELTGQIELPHSCLSVLLLLSCLLFSPHSRSPWSLLTMAVLDHSVNSLKSLSRWLYIHFAECGCCFGVPATLASTLACICLGPCLPVSSPTASREVMSLLPGEQAPCPPLSYLFRSQSCPFVCHSLLSFVWRPLPCPPQLLLSAHLCPLVCMDVTPVSPDAGPPAHHQCPETVASCPHYWS